MDWFTEKGKDRDLVPSKLLSLAIIKGKPLEVTNVLEKNPELVPLYNNRKNPYDDNNPLAIAIDFNKPECMQELLQKGFDSSRVDCFGENILQQSVNQPTEKPDIVKVLLINGADPNAKTKRENGIYSQCPLYTAINFRHLKTIQLLLTHGANVVNDSELDDRFAIHLACMHSLIAKNQSVGSQISIVQLLLKHGADINAITRFGFLPIHLIRSPKLLKFLLEETDIDVNATTLISHRTLLHTIVELARKSNRESPSKQSTNQLMSTKEHVYTREEYLAMIRLLVKHGALADIKEHRKQKTAYDLTNGDKEILSILIKAKKSPLVKEFRN